VIRVGGGPPLPFISMMSGLLGMLFLIAVSAYNDGGNTKRVLVGIASIVTTVISILFFNKGFTLIAISLFSLFCSRGVERNSSVLPKVGGWWAH
jgi:hypothetical protein